VEHRKTRKVKPVLVAVTGGVGSGKTLFARALADCGGVLIDADGIAAEIVDEDRAIRDQIENEFGRRFFNAAGRLKRRELGRYVFGDAAALKKLNHIIWPTLLRTIRHRIDARSANGAPVIVDMAIVFEAGVSDWFDLIIVVDAPPDKRKAWLRARRQWHPEEIRDRMASQMDVREKRMRAHVVIENDGAPDELIAKASRVYHEHVIRNELSPNLQNDHREND